MLIVLALVCKKFSVEQKNGLARQLLSLLPSRVRVLPPTPVSPPGPNFTSSDTFLPVDNRMPDLSRLATGNSFLIFNILDITDEDLTDWLSSPADRWSSDQNSPDFCAGFAMLKCFAENTPFVNDAAERFFFVPYQYFQIEFQVDCHLKERISMTHQEDTLQEILSMTFEERSRVKARRGDHLCKASLENILPP